MIEIGIAVKYRFSVILSILGFMISMAQGCPDLVDPLNGATNVPVDTTIQWEAVDGVTGYIISIGTSPGATDIVNEQPTGSLPSYTPDLGLPDNTQVFVTITLFYFNLPNITCPSQSFTTEDVTVAPGCTSPTFPVDGETDVNFATTINWNYVSGATGYFISIGTAPGSGDIVNNLDVGNSLSYNPNPDLPPSTTIYVTVIPYNENGTATGCLEYSFTTGLLVAVPDCVSFINPADGAINVPLTPFVEWEDVPGATGYIVYIGRTPTENDILDGGVFFTNSTFVINFEPNNVYFIRVVPFNDAGEAIGCEQTSFSTVLGCGPFLNAETGELETLNPDLNFPDQVGICLNDVPTTISATDPADGYRWYQYNQFDEPILIGEGPSIDISEEGEYRLEAYNISETLDFSLECPSEIDFTIVSSERPTISGAVINTVTGGISIEIFAEGSGSYEYSLSEDGPFQDSNFFPFASEDTEFVYARDRNGCGMDSFPISGLVAARGFPKFFTPNGDGINYSWQYRPKEDDPFVLEVIYIFNRYGKLLKTLNPFSDGWDGLLSGELLPQSDYWYRAVTTEGEIFRGHFTLRR